MPHQAAEWADVNERPLRGINVAGLLGTALQKSLIVVAYRSETRDRRVGEYLEAFSSPRLPCSAELRQGRRKGLLAVPASIRAAASYLVSRLERIGGVRAIILETGDGEPRVVTYIERRDTGLRSTIYSAEREVYEVFANLTVEFRVISLDRAKCTLPTAKTEGAHVLLLR